MIDPDAGGALEVLRAETSERLLLIKSLLEISLLPKSENGFPCLRRRS
jgi:hypothetical protein